MARISSHNKGSCHTHQGEGGVGCRVWVSLFRVGYKYFHNSEAGVHINLCLLFVFLKYLRVRLFPPPDAYGSFHSISHMQEILESPDGPDSIAEISTSGKEVIFVIHFHQKMNKCFVNISGQK